MARGEIELAKSAGRELPPGVGIGPDGAPSTVPSEVLAGCQLPFGGHKGSNVALMVELLGAALVGTHLAVDHPPGTPFDTISRGLFVVAIDPGSFAQIGTNNGERLFDAILGSSPDARLPSQRRYAHRREVLEEGKLIDVPEATYKICMTLADEHGSAL
jgi:LDH2 family malate/lactate/ureidoglycolate dehydrogenase